MYQCCVEVWVNAALHVHKGRVLCLWHESFAARGEVQFTERRRGEIREVVVTKSPPATRERVMVLCARSNALGSLPLVVYHPRVTHLDSRTNPYATKLIPHGLAAG